MAVPSELAETFLDKDLFTEEEYFAWEGSTSGRWEFSPEGPPDALGRYLGAIRAMSSGTPDHSGIAASLITIPFGNAGKETRPPLGGGGIAQSV